MVQENVPEGRISAQENNIRIAKVIAGLVRTTLGPKGMDKLLVDAMGDVTVTNDGVTILRELTIENPIAKMMVDIAKTQESEVGDGTTTAVILAGELLNKAELLLKKKVHPTVIVKGFKLACDKSLEYLEEIGVSTVHGDRKVLKTIAETAMTGKGSEDHKDLMSSLVVDAVLMVENDGVDKTDIRIEKRIGGSAKDTCIIEGIVLDKERCHPNMPKKVEVAKILVLDLPLEIKDTSMEAKISVNSPLQMQRMLDQEAKMIKDMVDKVISTGANVLICGRSIDDSALHFLGKENIFAVKRINREDQDKICKATGARMVTNFEELSSKDLGKAEMVEERFIGNSNMVFITGCEHAKSVTILVRGSTEQLVSEIARVFEDGIGDVVTVLRSNKIVGVAGAVEMMLSKRLNDYANTLKGREQLAVKSFAEVLESIPETLAENSGLDPIDVIAELRSSSVEWAGIDVFTGEVINSFESGIIEPLQVKSQAISSATEVACMILRIDEVMAIVNNPNRPPEGFKG